MKPGLVIGPYKLFDTAQYFVFAFSFFSSEIFFLNPVFSCSSSCLQVDRKTIFVFHLYLLHLRVHLHQNLQRILVLNFEATLKLFCTCKYYRVDFGATVGHYRKMYFEKSSDNTLQSIRRCWIIQYYTICIISRCSGRSIIYRILEGEDAIV